jgi:hypothetical protein
MHFAGVFRRSSSFETNYLTLLYDTYERASLRWKESLSRGGWTCTSYFGAWSPPIVCSELTNWQRYS